MGNGDLKQYENSKRISTYMVSDLLIQSRGYERNYLAVEMKRKGSNRHVDEDKERLSSMVSPRSKNEEQRCVHNTLVGAFIVYGTDGVKIELYENIKGKGVKSDPFMIPFQEF